MSSEKTTKKIQSKGLFKKYAGQGVVKAVLSGDSLVIMGGVGPGQIPREKVFSLSGITAPQCSRSRDGQDEPFGWEAREILRRKCIGQAVFFTVEYETGNDSGRAFGSCKVLSDDTDLASFMVSSGFATVKISKDGRIPPGREHLINIQRGASNMEFGVHNKSAKASDHTRTVNHFPNLRALLDGNRSIEIPAIVDRVREGNVVILELLGKGLQHTMLTLHLSGIACPKTPLPYSVRLANYERDVKNDPNTPKPKRQKAALGSLEAKFFTEARLLHRNVKVVLHAVDKRGNIFGVINYVQGDISKKLIEFGYATVINWSASTIGQLDQFQKIEAAAKENSVGLWQFKKDKQKSNNTKSVAEPWNGTVTEVNSGDSFLIMPADSKQGVRVNLASVQAPRINGRDRAQSEYLAFDAREYIRERVIGKSVQVIPEYTRRTKINDKYINRVHSTVLFNSADLAQGLVEKGLATVVRHGIEEDRSRRYDILLRVEDRAVKENIGIYAENKSNRGSNVTDLSIRKKKDDEDKEDSKARAMLNSLRRSSPLNAVVEYVYNGGRAKLYIPSKKTVLICSLKGVRTPVTKAGFGLEENDILINPELHKIAADFTRSHINQRNITVDIQDIDRGDNFLGTIIDSSGKNIIVGLLENGLARIVGRNTRSDEKYGAAFQKAEETAKNHKAGIWLNYVEPTNEVTEEILEVATAPVGGEKVKLLVTEILDGVSFYARVADDENIKVVDDAMAEQESSFNEEGGDLEIAKGSIYAGLFDDDKWYRVQANRRANKEGTEYEALFIDYGNKSILPVSKFRALPASLAAKKPLAHFCVLAGCTAPKGTSQYAEGSTQALGERVFDNEVEATVVASDSDKLHVSLNDGGDNPIEQDLLEAGNIRLLQRPFKELPSDFISKLKGFEENAIRKFVGIWEYGNVSDEEDNGDDDGRVPLRR